jgi:hypothetical protein
MERKRKKAIKFQWQLSLVRRFLNFFLIVKSYFITKKESIIFNYKLLQSHFLYKYLFVNTFRKPG